MIKYTGNIEDVTLLLKHMMLDLDLTQKDVCNASRHAKSTVSNFLNNQTLNPGINTIFEICNAMNCDLMIDIVPKKNRKNRN